jgi:nicotinamide riboside kinase
MRIAFSGVQNSGKTTLVKNFLSVWNNYSTPEKTYRDIIVEKNLDHSSKCTKDGQWEILNFMVDQLQSYDKNDKVIFDRCPIDNLVYTLWAHEKEIEGFDKEFVDKCINITKESMRHLDIIFLLRYDPTIAIVEDGLRDTDRGYIIEIDNIFSALMMQYEQNYSSEVFFPKNDSPGFFELPSSLQRRIDIISEYLTPEGNLYGEETSIFQNVDELEALVRQQQSALDEETREKELFRKFGLS